MKVCLMGASLDTGNMGVSALAASLIKIVDEFSPGAEITLLVGQKESGTREVFVGTETREVKVTHYRLHPRAGLRNNILITFFAAILYRIFPVRVFRMFLTSRLPCLDALANSDLVGDIRGGDSFSDIYGLKRLVVGSLPDMAALALGKTFVLFPQTYGPYSTGIARKLARLVIRRAAAVMARDPDSYQMAAEMLGSKAGNKPPILSPDVAFLLDPVVPDAPDIEPPLVRGEGDRLVGLNVSGLLYNGGYTRSNMFGLKFDYRDFINELCRSLLDLENIHLLLVPHTFAPSGNVESDPDACRAVFEELCGVYPERLHLVASKYDQSGIKGIIGFCDFFVGSRMHACIAALSQGIPTIGLAYSKKFLGVFKTVGQESMVRDARHSDHEGTIRFILEAARNDGSRKDLEKRVEEARQSVQKQFRNIFEGLEKAGYDR